MSRTVLALAAALVCSTAGAAPAKAPPPWGALIGMFDATLRDYGVVGGSVALVQGGGITAHHEYGLSDRASGTPVDQDTLFHWASITKTLTGIAIMQLRDRGKLTLEDRITSYLPELRRVHNPFGSMDDITLRMLLDHSAGFQGGTWPYKQGNSWEPFEPTTWEQLVAMMPYQEIAFKPGSRFSYSNPGIIYLGRVIEILSGDPWQYYIQKNIFTPLGMTRSYFGYTPYHLKEHRGNSYNVVPGADGKLEVTENSGEFDPGITIPNGGWNSPLADAARYMSFLIGDVKGDAQLQKRYDGVLSRPTLEEMWKVQVPTEGEGAGLGLTYFLRGTGDARIVGHTGSQSGFCAYLYFNPVKRHGVIAAFNSRYTMPSPTSREWFTKLESAAFEVIR